MLSRAETQLKEAEKPAMQDALPDTSRTKMCERLNGHLADAIDLGMQAKQAHWNVQCASYPLHKLLDEIADCMREHVDGLAGRISQLGGVVEGTLGAVKKRTRLAEYPLTLSNNMDHLEALRSGIATFATATRRSSGVAHEVRDSDTADLLTEVARAADDYHRRVGAYL
jgi:starvation-inducible DNA-binding protein